jgi:hypothetical protein
VREATVGRHKHDRLVAPRCDLDEGVVAEVHSIDEEHAPSFARGP